MTPHQGMASMKDTLSKHLLALEVDFHKLVDELYKLHRENDGLRLQLKLEEDQRSLLAERLDENEAELSSMKQVVADLRKAVEDSKTVQVVRDPWWRRRKSTPP